MNIAAAISLYGGGPGSGCNPAVGKCGRTPRGLEGLAEEARKAKSFEEFEHDYLGEIKHGRYWHVTSDPNFKIDPTKGPKDASSMADGKTEVGALMITSDPENWTAGYGKSRPYIAEIDMKDVPREAYYQVKRGFGNEFFVTDPSKARVVSVLPVAKALAQEKRYQKMLEKNFSGEEDLQKFYDSVKAQ